MRIGIVARIKQGDILQALAQRGWNQRQGAEFLGLSQTVFSSLINLKWVPQEFSVELTVKLYELTGKMPEELFPEWARQRDFLEMPKVVQRFFEATPELLQQAGQAHLLTGPEEVLGGQSARDTIDDMLRQLTPIRERVLRKVVMGEEPLEKVAEELGRTPSEVRRIRDEGLRDLRNPQRIRKLRNAFHQIL